MMDELSEIQKFYYEKTIFITGATGLLGKCLVEHLLRSCPIKSIFLLVRPKRNLTFDDRIKEYFNDLLFETIKSNNSKDLNKVVFMYGDITLRNFGLRPEDYNTIIEQTNVVFHAAASVRFVSPLHEIVPLNILGTKTMIDLAKNIKNLQALLHVSTMCVYCDRSVTDETVQSPKYTPEFLIDLTKNMTRETLDQCTPSLLGTLPNTYVLTKQAAEQYLCEAHENMPVAIYRPCGIIPTYREPLPGWSNHHFAAIGIAHGLATGAIKVVHLDEVARHHLVPVDMAVNCMIAAAWNITVHRDTQVKIYNHFTEDNALGGYQFMDAFINSDYPLECAIRYPGYTLATSSWQYNIYALFIQTIRNALIDMVCRVLGKNVNCNAKCKRAIMLSKVTKKFLEIDFNFQTKNLPALWKQLEAKDRELFNFNSYSLDWNEYLQIFSCGNKEILLKEDVSQLGKVRHKHQILHIYEYLFVILYGAAIWMVLYLMNIM